MILNLQVSVFLYVFALKIIRILDAKSIAPHVGTYFVIYYNMHSVNIISYASKKLIIHHVNYYFSNHIPVQCVNFPPFSPVTFSKTLLTRL
jgi:hypothetical protein